MLLRVLCSWCMNYCRHIFYFITRFAFKSIIVLYTVHKWFGMQHQTPTPKKTHITNNNYANFFLSLSFSLLRAVSLDDVMYFAKLRKRSRWNWRSIKLFITNLFEILFLKNRNKSIEKRRKKKLLHKFRLHHSKNIHELFFCHLRFRSKNVAKIFITKIPYKINPKCNWPKSHFNRTV